jgi:TonB family protein
MATVTTSEFVKTREPIASFSMIEHKGIFARLVEIGSLAIEDFSKDPRGFLRELFAGDAKDLQRSKRLRMGLALGLATQIILFGVIAFFGWHRATAITNPDESLPVVTMLDPNTPKPKPNKPETSPNGETASKNPAPPKGTPNAGGSLGGGGQENPAPARQGVLPQSIPNPAMISPTAPPSSSPVIPMNPTLEGAPTPPPPPDAKIGLPNGNPNTDSGGQGKGGGLGDKGNGPGAGDNPGPGGSGRNPNGTGPGGSGEKNGTPGSPTGTGTYTFGPFSQVSGSSGIRWIRRATPIVTPEAQANKVNGVVLLRATFNADGTITDIEIINRVDYMTESAIDSLKRSKFSPATVNGVPVTLRRVPVYIKVSTELR